eukprot:9345586-Pyramimonas_sp.AAC.2
MYCTVLFCEYTALCCTVLFCDRKREGAHAEGAGEGEAGGGAAPTATALYCTVTVLYCTVLFCEYTALCCAVL